MNSAADKAADVATVSAEDAAALRAYRQSLIDAEKQGQDSFDKTVISLSGGALGISFIFIKDVIGPNQIIHPELLLATWICWAGSTLAVLISFYTSNRALRRAIEQCDNDTIHCEPPGGFFSKITRTLNKAGIVFLILGIGLMSAFVYLNLLQGGITNDEANETHSAPASNTSNPAPAPNSGARPDATGNAG